MKRIIRSKKIMFFSILVLLSMTLSLTYSAFIINTEKYNASEMLVSELIYGIEIQSTEDGQNVDQENKTVTVTGGSTEVVKIKITSLNEIDSRYDLEYRIKSGRGNVYYANTTSWKPTGIINEDKKDIYEKTITVVIESEETMEVEFIVNGGYTYNELAVRNGYSQIIEEKDNALNYEEEKNIKELIKEENNCKEDKCLNGGETEHNYLQYPTNNDKTKNLWRIIGSYTEGIKVISNEVRATSKKTEIKTSLTNIYNGLDENKEKYIYPTTNFNCSESGCIETTLFPANIGLISTYEYTLLGGTESYLKPESSYYGINNTEINNITQEGIKEVTDEETSSGIRPSIYLESDLNITGSGTKSDPYIIYSKGTEPIVKYTIDGSPVQEPPDKNTYIVNTVKCTNEVTATWDDNKGIQITNGKTGPTTCTVDFKEGYTVEMVANPSEGATITQPASKKVGRVGQTEFKVTVNNGYTLTDATVSCDGKANGSVNSNGTITISNIKQDNRCTITVKALPKVTLNVTNGKIGTLTTSTITASKLTDATVTFSNVTSNTNYTFSGQSVSCNGGASGSLSGTTVTVSNVSQDTTCTLTGKILPRVTLNVTNGTGGTSKYATSLTGATVQFTGINPSNNYTATNATVTCNNGASGSISGTTVTINNVSKDNTCTVVMMPKVTLTVTNGTGTSSQYVGSIGGSVKFTGVSPSSNYTFSGQSVTCDGGASGSLSGTTVTVSNITKVTNCSLAGSYVQPDYEYTVTLKCDFCEPYLQYQDVKGKTLPLSTVFTVNTYLTNVDYSIYCENHATGSYDHASRRFTVTGINTQLTCYLSRRL